MRKKVLFIPESVFLHTFWFALGGNLCLVLVRYTCGSIKWGEAGGSCDTYEEKNVFWLGNPKERDNLKDLLADGNITLKRFLSEMGGFGSE
jgi:hypothetical protein